MRRLAVETPALFIAFDLLVRNGIDLAGMKLSDRRRELEDFANKCFARNPTFRLSPASAELDRRAEMAEGKRRRHRRRDGEATGFALPGG